MRRALSLLAVVAALVAVAPAKSADASDRGLRAGVGQADITPLQTGYYLGGFTRADRLALGQHTRLFSKAMVLERGGEKIALVSIDLFMIPAGMQQQIAALAGDGFEPGNVLILPTHTHSGPGGFANFPTYNTAAPSTETITNPISFVELLDPKPADRQLYTFLTTQIAKSIRRADRDLDPALAGWGQGSLTGITRNRSIEAHLADHGITEDRGSGSPEQDPEGSLHTIDPVVDVLRVDKVVGGERVPIGGFSSFANHGTVVKAPFQAYNGDHHSTAHRVFEKRVRRAGDVPGGQLVLNVYGNSNEGDLSAGLDHTGPAGANEVGKAEAKEMFAVWKKAGRKLSDSPEIDFRWTRVCFCGAAAGGGTVANDGRAGAPFFTGSEEERGPLFDVTGEVFEDRRSATPSGDSQGHKIVVPAGGFPAAVPLTVTRIGDRAIASLPGEPTKEIGERVEAAVLDVLRPEGVRRVTVSGLTNDFISYITTPEEYERQHYEGGSTLFGPYEGPFLTDRLVELATALRDGDPAAEPYPYDPENGVGPDGPPYPDGAEQGTLVQDPPRRVQRLGHAKIAWQGAPDGHDRPLEKPFVIVERREGGKWKRVDSDLGLAILWRVDSTGNHTAYWEAPLGAPLGKYRLVVSARRYRLEARPFRLIPDDQLVPREVERGGGRVGIRLDYPAAVENVDLLARPASARGGEVTFDVGGETVTVRKRKGSVFSVDAGGEPVSIAARAAQDRFGNTTSERIVLGGTARDESAASAARGAEVAGT